MNESGQIHHMSMLVGQLKEAVDGVKLRMDRLDQVWGERERSASSGRQVLHDKMDSLAHDFVRTEAAVENVQREVATVIKPAVETLKTEREQNEGARRLSSKLWVGAIAIAGVLGGGVSEVFHLIRGH